MDAKVRGQRDLGASIEKFHADSPDQLPGEAATRGEVTQILTEMDQNAVLQQQGLAAERSATAMKSELRRKAEGHVRHLNRVARRAMREVPDVELKFVLLSSNLPYRTFRNAARTIQAEAEAQKDLLLKNGMSEAVRTDFDATLDQFDVQMDAGEAGQQLHVGASAKLVILGRELVQVARVLDTLYRTRFRDDPEMLAKWESASNGLRTSRSKARGSAPAAPAAPAGGTAPTPVSESTEVKPAA